MILFFSSSINSLIKTSCKVLSTWTGSSVGHSLYVRHSHIRSKLLKVYIGTRFVTHDHLQTLRWEYSFGSKSRVVFKVGEVYGI